MKKQISMLTLQMYCGLHFQFHQGRYHSILCIDNQPWCYLSQLLKTNISLFFSRKLAASGYWNTVTVLFRISGRRFTQQVKDC
jgi:hypothetical protein